MNKLLPIIGILAVGSSPAFAAAVNYSGTAKSGTAADPNASITLTTFGSASLYYVDPASGTASNKNAPAVSLTKASNWSFDFSNPSQVAFTGSISYGNYAIQDNVTSPISIDGRQSYFGVTQSFSGVGTFNQATNTFTYTISNTTADVGGGSVETHTGAPVCANGTTNALGSVCGNFSSTPGALNWEGLTLNLVFAADKSTFAGSLQGTNISGSGITGSNMKINWQVNGATTPVVPIPAAAWLFGSGLLSFAGMARRRLKG